MYACLPKGGEGHSSTLPATYPLLTIYLYDGWWDMGPWHLPSLLLWAHAAAAYAWEDIPNCHFLTCLPACCLTFLLLLLPGWEDTSAYKHFQVCSGRRRRRTPCWCDPTSQTLRPMQTCTHAPYKNLLLPACLKLHFCLSEHPPFCLPQKFSTKGRGTPPLPPQNSTTQSRHSDGTDELGKNSHHYRWRRHMAASF